MNACSSIKNASGIRLKTSAPSTMRPGKRPNRYLGDLFVDTDYPADIRTKFKFEYRYLSLGLPGKANLLTPEIYEREKEKFETLMEETREIAMTALRTEFGQLVTHLTDRLNGNDGKPKVLKSSMFNKIKDWLDGFRTRNIFEDEKLVELTDQALSVIGGVSSYGLQYNDRHEKEDPEGYEFAQRRR